MSEKPSVPMLNELGIRNHVELIRYAIRRNGTSWWEPAQSKLKTEQRGTAVRIRRSLPAGPACPIREPRSSRPSPSSS